MASDAIQKRASSPGVDEDSEGKPGVLKLLGKIGGSKSNRKSGTDSILSPTASSSSSTTNSISSSQQQSIQGLRNSTSGTKQPLSAREDSRKAVPSLSLPGAPTATAAGSLSDNGEASPGRAIAPKKNLDGQDKSLNASTTSLALRKLFLGKPESLTMDDFALWKQFREMEPDFNLEMNATSPYPFLKVAPPIDDDEVEETRDAPPDLERSGAAMSELLPPKEDTHDVPYEQWYSQMINLVQLHKQELSTSKYNEAPTPRSARMQATDLRS